ncbi:MAG: methylated-DNA--[protein]-cysteine S-methyltransferase [Bacillota bacterium]
MEKVIFETVAGYTALCWSGSGLVLLNLPEPDRFSAEEKLRTALEGLAAKSAEEAGSAGHGFTPGRLIDEVRAYFGGEKVSLAYPVDWSFYTEFQKKVLKRVHAIPWGSVLTYGQVASDIGNASASRAVGGAAGSNRVLLVVPCHRVIAANGKIGGFGAGVGWKERLLKNEGYYR